MPYFFSNACDERAGFRRLHRGVEGDRAFLLGGLDQPLIAVGALIDVDRGGVGASARAQPARSPAPPRSRQQRCLASSDAKRDHVLLLLSYLAPLVAHGARAGNAAKRCACGVDLSLNVLSAGVPSP